MTEGLSSSFWLSDIDKLIAQYQSGQRSGTEFVLRLASIRRAIANFVRIVTKQDIPVKFSTGKQSYTDGKRVVVISANDDPSKLDVMVGLALHESAHIILSNRTKDVPESTPLFEWLEWFLDSFLSPDEVPPEIMSEAKRHGLDAPQVRDMVHTLVNYLEDRRIDQWMYRKAPGYRSYYDAMYDEYWHSQRVGDLLEDARTHRPTLTNYEFHTINMTNERAKPTYLPGLAEIWNLIDLPNLNRFNEDMKRWSLYEKDSHVRPLIVQTALDVLLVTLKNAEVSSSKPQSKRDGGRGDADPDNLDMARSRGDGEVKNDKNGKEDDLVRGELEKQRKFLKGDVEKLAITPENNVLMEDLESAGAELKEVGGDFGTARVVVYKKLTTQLLHSKGFLFSSGRRNPEMAQVIADGVRMGNVLASKLKVMGEQSTLKVTRQKSGKVDQRILSSLGVGDVNIFKRTFTDSIRPVDLHFTVDGSSSMKGKKWNDSMRVAVALAQASQRIESLNVVISIRASVTAIAQVLIAFDSRIDSMVKLKQQFEYLRPQGGTPEGLCFAAIKNIILSSSSSSSRYFVNISDGEPMFSWQSGIGMCSYTGHKAHVHTAEQVQQFRVSGIEVLSYYVEDPQAYSSYNMTNARAAFKSMYGKAAQFIDTTQVIAIAKTLNQLFLTR
jgi:hypothetical protein